MKKEWEAPIVLEVNSLPEALGSCEEGTTGYLHPGCSSGEYGVLTDTGVCLSGGVARTFCTSGAYPEMP